MKNTIQTEYPRERCIDHGAAVLSLRECLAILIGTGTKQQDCLQLAGSLLKMINPIDSPFDEASFFEYLESSSGIPPQIPGIGPAKISRIQCSFELARRYYSFCERRSQRKTSSNSQSPERTLERMLPKKLYHSTQEWLGFVAVDRFGKLRPLVLVERGTRMQVNFDPCDLFRKILICGASGVYLFHFHPSGRCDPSVSDITITRKIRKILMELQIYFYGHWIVTPSGLNLIRGTDYDISLL